MTTQTDLDELLRRVEALEADNRSLRAELERATPPASPVSAASPTPAVAPTPSGIGRRRLLLGGASAGAAAVAAVVAGSASPAAAANGDPLMLGESNTATLPTTLEASAGFVAGLKVTNTGPGIEGVGGGFSIGVAGRSTDGEGVRGDSTSGVGVFGACPSGVGVRGGSTSGPGVVGASSSGAGVRGESDAGIGVEATGPIANLRLPVVGTRSAPTADTVVHLPGDLVVDGKGALWVCVAEGTPGQWRALAGEQTAGALHLLAAPVRVYDSRPSTSPSQGPKTPFAPGATRVIDCKVNSSGVPSGATGVLLTVLLVNASATNGNLTVWANGTPRPSANTMVWGGAAGRFTTSATSAVDGSVRIQVNASARTDLVLDVVGYYR